MKQIIGKKQFATNASFLQARESIEELVSYDEASELVSATVEDMKKVIGDKKAAYAWSGGKDSLALQYVCQQAGVELAVMGIASHLEYPAFMEFVNENKPQSLTIIDNEKLTLQWLSEHEDMLFPTNAVIAAKWFRIIQHRAQEIFFNKHHLDMLLLGRRIQDGNYCGNNKIYTNGRGITRFSPIAEWKHEQVMAVIHYFMNDSYPPIYDWENGFVVGTGVWPARQRCKSVEQGYNEVYKIDKSLVIDAANYLISAKIFLNNK